MKSIVVALAALAMLAAMPAFAAKTEGEYVAEAQALAGAGKIAEAVSLLGEAAKEHPQSSDIYAYYGLYTGMSAGQAKDYVEAGRLAGESFALLDKAVELGPRNPAAYLCRGIMGVRVPAFLGRLESGKSDLKYVSELAPGTVAAKQAEALLAELEPSAPREERLASLEAKPSDPVDIASLKKRLETESKNAALYLELGRALAAAGRFEEAREVLYRHNELDPSSAEAYRLLTLAVGGLADVGYDARIAEDTNLRTSLAFEVMSAADKAVELDPANTESRLTRGMLGVAMPFFVDKHSQGVEDLEYVLEHTTAPAESAQAYYWLGYAREREAMSFWRKVATKYPDTDAARMALAGMRPTYGRFEESNHPKPVVSIDFVLGFRDELAPQVAVWIEDQSGAHVKTVFVSGFAGNVKGRQVTLPVWAAISKFEGSDAVTGASIDVGHYVYAWDCAGLDGKPVKPGRYTAKVEASFWPSMKYELAEASFTVGKKGETVRVETGNYIPSLVVTYYPQ